ncbi:hypothetical protein PHET_09893 [Paragonimus heterotremus]|uniref:BAR domain-containing protein n=1 Tax=Paragonimus heterotremus TaxID=100268 RepID=A0A8J4WNF9_9TREM|nr:hypothetical protein PHET_09893 [Paragonimus heterotremus]
MTAVANAPLIRSNGSIAIMCSRMSLLIRPRSNSLQGRKTEEAFKTTDKTLLDAHLEDLIKQRDMRQRWAQSLLNLVIAFVQPNPANRMEDMVLKGFDRKKERVNDAEQLGESMISISRELGSSGVTN